MQIQKTQSHDNHLDLNVSYLYSWNVRALRGCIALVPECHSSMRKFASNLKHASRGVAINLVAGRNGSTGSLATNQCSKKILDNDDNDQSSGAISPSTFSRTFGNTKHLVNPEKGGQDAIFKALHVPKPCAGHRRHSKTNSSRKLML